MYKLNSEIQYVKQWALELLTGVFLNFGPSQDSCFLLLLVHSVSGSGIFPVFQFCPLSLYIRTPLSVLLHLYHGYSYCKLFKAFEQISNLQMFRFLLLASMYITSAIYHWNNRFDLWLCPTGETRHRSLPTLFKEKRQINLHCKLKRSTVSQKKK